MTDSDEQATEHQQALADFAKTAGQNADQAPDRPRRPKKGKLERVGVRTNLIRLLAQGTRTQRELAAMHDCSQSSIAEFAERHGEEIEARRQADANALDKVWIANKESRLQELSELYQKLEDGDTDPDVVRAAKDLLRAAAEELGQIPNKTTVVQAQPFEVRIMDGNPGQVQPDTSEDGAEKGDEYDQGI